MCPNQTLVSKFMSVLFCHSFLVQILVSRYRMALNHTQESKVMAVWICLALPCLISASRYIMRPNWTSEWNVMTIWISQELLWFNFERFHISWASIIHLRQKLWPFEFVESFSISSVSIHYWPESDIRVISYGRLNLPREFVFNSGRLDTLLAWTGHASHKLWLFEFVKSFYCSTPSVTIYHGSQSHTPSQNLWLFEFALRFHV